MADVAVGVLTRTVWRLWKAHDTCTRLDVTTCQLRQARTRTQQLAGCGRGSSISSDPYWAHVNCTDGGLGLACSASPSKPDGAAAVAA